MTKELNLEKIRQEIDSIDDKIINLLSQRFELVEQVGLYKLSKNLPSMDSKRWQEVLNSRIAKAEEKGLNTNLVRDLYEMIHTYAILQEDVTKLNNSNINKIVIHGFRATGKTVGSKKLIKKLEPEWKLVEMDDEIVKRTGKTISELTNNGESWSAFRKIESDIFEEYLKSDEKLVISTGGGTCVNNFADPHNEMSYGELNRNILKKYSKNAVSIVLDAKEAIILTYIEDKERATLGTRPNLNSEAAKKINKEAENLSKEERENLIIKSLIQETKKVYRERKPLYQIIPNSKIIDTSCLSDDQIADKMLAKVVESL